jgi:hypothetical protein
MGLPPIDHTTVDEANILNRWLFRNWGQPAILPIEGEPPDWEGLASRALALSNDDLMREVRSVDEEADELLEGEGVDNAPERPSEAVVSMANVPVSEATIHDAFA